MSVPLCRDCAHIASPGLGDVPLFPRCVHPEASNQDPVTGMPLCTACRQVSGFCGPTGIHFKDRLGVVVVGIEEEPGVSWWKPWRKLTWRSK